MFEETALFGDTWYFQEDKINEMYGKSVDWIEKERITEKGTLSKVTARINISLGELLNWLGLKADVEGALEQERANSTKVIQYLPPQKKLLIIFKRFEKESLLCDLNKKLAENGSGATFFYCTAKIRLSMKKDNPDICIISGQVEEKEFTSYCSKKYFTGISSSLFTLLLDVIPILGNETLEAFCLGTILKEKPLLLKFYYIGGKTESLNELYKSQG